MGKITIKGGAYNRKNLLKKDKEYLADQCLGLKEITESQSARIRELEDACKEARKELNGWHEWLDTNDMLEIDQDEKLSVVVNRLSEALHKTGEG